MRTPDRHDAYDRALNDEAFRLAVRAHYRGSRDVLDALWWRAHPDRPSPRGEVAPGSRVRALQRRVFAADADAAGDAAVHRELRELEAEIASETDAIDDAVSAAVSAAAPGNEDAGSPALESASAPSGAAQSGAAEPLSAEPGTPVRASPSRARAVAALVVVAVLGGLVGAQIVSAIDRGPRGTSAAASGNAVALEIFDQPRTMTDVPSVSLPASFDGLTTRSLGSISWAPGSQPAESPFYAVRADRDRVCLVLMIDDFHYLSSCVSETEFAASGLRLYWTNDRGLLSDGLAALSGPMNWRVVWTPDGVASVGPAADEDVP